MNTSTQVKWKFASPAPLTARLGHTQEKSMQNLERRTNKLKDLVFTDDIDLLYLRLWDMLEKIKAKN